MAKTLKDYFTMIRTRREVLDEIGSREKQLAVFKSWREGQQEEFLNFCTGVKGVKILYDSFFKEIFSPEYHPERIERLLSAILGKWVKIRSVLPNDSVRIADEQSLLITDILVELEDGSFANIEIQKIGYAFPGQRVACYSADTLLRPYTRVRSERKKKFTYHDIKTVYTIVFFENSTREFQKIKDSYIHRSRQIFDTGLELETLQEYVLIPLDIFRETLHNKIVENELEAWLSFLTFDEPERIMQLIERFPQFRVLYEDVYEMCRNIEGVMNMYSKELAELDRNTVKYMIEEQEKVIKVQTEVIQKKEEQLDMTKEQLEAAKISLKEKDDQLSNNEERLNMQAREIAELRKRLEELIKKS